MRNKLIHISRIIFGQLFKIKFLEDLLVEPDSFLFRWRGVLVPLWHNYSKPTIRKSNQNGLNYIFDISDYMDWKAYFQIGTGESKWLFNQINTNDIILDVGANLGYYALNFANRAIKGKVICFEPDFNNFAKLERNLNANNFKNIEVHNFGLGSEKGTFLLGVIDKQNTGMNTVITEDNTNVVESSEIQIEALDGLPFIDELSKIDLIKVDIEGYEFQFLQGARETLRKHHPMIFMELCDSHLKRQSSSAKEVVKFIQDLGYQSIVNTKFPNEEINIVDLENCQFDIICHKK